MRKLTLDDATLSNLAARPAVRVAFPFMAAKRAAAGRAGCCNKPAGGGGHWAAVKQAIAGLPPARLAELKRLAGADAFLLYLSTDGRVSSLVL